MLNLGALGTYWPEQLDARALGLAEQVRRDGITYNVYGSDGVAARAWPLQLLPLVMEPETWAPLEQGVLQRARLLQALLADVNGAQQVLKQGLLPATLLHRHPGHLPQLHGIAPVGGRHLHLLAFDLTQTRDGAWCVLAQRTQAPSGLGYVLLNRLAVARQFPQPFAELAVQHVASSYRQLLATLQALARPLAGGASPNLALLTPGPYNETYHEHVALARYLGLALVEGGDLAVRGEQLMLRTVQGMRPLHGLLRRVDDDWCDPLELRAGSSLGVPGLLQVLRAGNLAMVNALGSGWLESPALHGFMGGLAQRLLGEPLLLSAPSTWWCGEEAAFCAARGRQGGLRGLRLLPAFEPLGAASMSPQGIEALIEADPEAWVLQAEQALGTAPVWRAGVVQPCPAVVRVYAMADEHGTWKVLPGGMTRVAAHAGQPVAMQAGGMSLDTWVRTHGVVDSFSLLAQPLGVQDLGAMAAAARPLSSRAAENLFWLGRYTERAELVVRSARALLGLARRAPMAVAAAADELARQLNLVPWGTPALGQDDEAFARALCSALFEPAAGSLATNLGHMGRCAGVLRERLANDHARLLQAMAEDGRQYGGDAQATLQALERAGLNLAAVTGVQTDRMTRDHGWRFLTVGRLHERLIGQATVLAALARHGALQQAAGVELALELFDSTITYRARFQHHEGLLPLTEALGRDATNPRSLAGTVRRLRTELGKLPGEQQVVQGLVASFPAEHAGLALQAADLAAQLVQACNHLATQGRATAHAVGLRWFTHAEGLELL